MSLRTFTRAYIEALYFTETGDTDQPSVDACLSLQALRRIVRDCKAFYSANHHLFGRRPIPLQEPGDGTAGDVKFEKYLAEDLAGHDFWLTRNGHGAGFWDGDWPEPQASILDRAATAFGEVWAYAGDDGRIYL